MHTLVWLLALKTHQVFQSRVIPAIIDQNWDLKGFRAVLWRVFEVLSMEETEAVV